MQNTYVVTIGCNKGGTTEWAVSPASLLEDMQLALGSIGATIYTATTGKGFDTITEAIEPCATIVFGLDEKTAGGAAKLLTVLAGNHKQFEIVWMVVGETKFLQTSYCPKGGKND